MDRPSWVPAPAWTQLERVLADHPLHAADVLDDLEAASSDFTPELRCLLLDRFTRSARRRVPLPAAAMIALSELSSHVRRGRAGGPPGAES